MTPPLEVEERRTILPAVSPASASERATLTAEEYAELESRAEQLLAQLELHEALAGDLGDAEKCIDLEAISRPGMVTPKLREDLFAVYEILLALRARVDRAVEHYREEHTALADRLHAGCACEES